MKTFQRAETVICGAAVKNAAGTLTQPATSMMVTVTDPAATVVVDAAAMTYRASPVTVDDVSCNYTYDYAPAADAAKGIYRVRYTATDGTRVTIQDDSFVLE